MKVKGALVIDIPNENILICILGFLVVWLVLAMSLNLRDARKRKRLQQARQQEETPETMPVEQVRRLAEWRRLQQGRQQAEASETIPVEQVIRLAEWEMQQWMSETE
jgi:hypothetical protein